VGATPAQADTFFFHNDHLGTPQAVTNSTQQVVWQADYDPFGEVNETVSLDEQNLRFPGQYFDAETGLHYNYFRDYDPFDGYNSRLSSSQNNTVPIYRLTIFIANDRCVVTHPL